MANLIGRGAESGRKLTLGERRRRYGNLSLPFSTICVASTSVDDFRIRFGFYFGKSGVRLGGEMVIAGDGIL